MTKKNRDDFSERTKQQIGKRAGWICSFPACGKHTIGATSDGMGEINIGTAAHICAAAPGGPRYDESMSQEDRSSASNGVWMCRDHGKAIDSTDPQFTVGRLREWKRQAEEASWRRVLRNQGDNGQAVAINQNLADRLRAAVEEDLQVFRNTAKWPSTSVALTLEVDGFDAPVTTSALADAVITLDDLVLVAPPGMGKTATLFQIAEGVLLSGRGMPLVVPLGDWATESATILSSILKRRSFHGVTEGDLREAAARPGIVLLLDGWNELDAQARSRARVQVAALKAELPELGLIVSTRRQALDVPFAGTRIDLLPLNEGQQMQIAVAMRGDAGSKIVDQAWRTAGIRELISIPLYLTTLLSLPENVPFPTTKEEVLRSFVAAHEEDASHAEALYSAVHGFQRDYLDALAVYATRSSNTAISDSNARRTIAHTETALAEAGQITIKPQPDTVLNVLVSNHLLMRSGDTPGYSFQHQQFQEWYASHSVERWIETEAEGSEGYQRLKAEIFNMPAWEEPILFATERLARAGARQRIACGKAILAAFDVDPMLAAEMIFRSTDEVWVSIGASVEGLLARWHAPGTVDRALRFMLTCGRPEFLAQVWPLIANEDEQVSLSALRNCKRIRSSLLGKDAVGKIGALPPRVRMILLSEMAMYSGTDGLDLVAAIAKNDPDPEVQAPVVEALAFRRADRHVAVVLTGAHEETLDILVARELIDEVDDPEVKKSLELARNRLAESMPISDRIRSMVRAQSDQDHSADLIDLISRIELEGQRDASVQLLHEAYGRYPAAVAQGLLQRLRAGRPLFFGAADILASGGFALEEEAIIATAMGHLYQRDAFADAAASVLGPVAVGRMIDALLEAEASLRVQSKIDQAERDAYHGLRNRIANVPGPSLASAVMARSKLVNSAQMASMAELLARHPSGDAGHDRAFDAASIVAIQGLVEDWGSRMLASTDATRGDKASIATLASRVPSASLLPLLKRLLDDNLERYRVIREQVSASGWRQSDLLNEARQPMTHEYLRAFLAIQSPETAAMVCGYLLDEQFGGLAAQVLANQWWVASESRKDRSKVFGIDFAGVADRRAQRIADPGVTTDEAEAIFGAIEALIAQGDKEDRGTLAVSLGIVAVSLPHGEREDTIQRLVAMASRRARSDLVLGLVLSGDEINAEVVADGISETFEAAKSEPWILTQSDGYELKVWLRLLPFVSRPTDALQIIRELPAAYREPRFLEVVIEGLAVAPSSDAEEVLFNLAEEDENLYLNYRWRASALGLGTLSSARRIIALTANGAFDDAHDNRYLAREIGGLLQRHPELRSQLMDLLKDGPSTPGLTVLAHALENDLDESGVLLLTRFEQENSQNYLAGTSIERLVTEQVPADDWDGSYIVVPVSAASLRQRLLALTRDGGPTDVAARVLREIDRARDTHGIPETEPRHPDLVSGKPWPILRPDPNASPIG